jgi:primosomal protein N' (replication factor Y)
VSYQQRTLFSEPTPWEADDAELARVASVVFPIGPEQPFDYLVPQRLAGTVEPGRRVQVPLGRANRSVVGYCVRVETRKIDGRPLKGILDVVDPVRLLSPAMLRLTEWMADRYLSTWGQVLETVVPAAVREQAGTRMMCFASLVPGVAERIDELNLPKKQAAVVRRLAELGEEIPAMELALQAGCSMAPINTLAGRGLVKLESRRTSRAVRHFEAHPREDDHPLNEAQQKALDAILNALRGPRHETLLLHGVTGSGKTEVYIRAIQEVVGYGRQAIVLVPEISLTPQTVGRFRSRFDRVAVLHSRLSNVERHREWLKIATGQVEVVVGARSAVFAPAMQLGMVILDEEHEGSFKQAESPRYHAREIALERARREGIPLVLGSATPSLESWQRARDGTYRNLSLPRRVLDRPMPDVKAVDLRLTGEHRTYTGLLSRPLRQAMERALSGNGQVILLLNRRGYSRHIQCPACGFTMGCPACDVALVHHKEQSIALCHYCDYRAAAPARCPECRFAGIRYSGAGTERLEGEVRSRFPDVPLVRMDTDSMKKPGSHERALSDFREGRVRILLGTQMIAKGLDFPNVTLVGVVNADVALHLPDFRASERTFQLLVQVAGRTGRGDQGGLVLIQSYEPEHPVIQFALRCDFEGFAARELEMREALLYPPFSSMIRIVVRGPEAGPAEEFARSVADRLKERGWALPVRVLGPAPAPLSRLRGKFRFHLHMLSKDGAELRTAVRETLRALKSPKEVEWMADVDPLDML